MPGRAGGYARVLPHRQLRREGRVRQGRTRRPRGARRAASTRQIGTPNPAETLLHLVEANPDAAGAHVERAHKDAGVQLLVRALGSFENRPGEQLAPGPTGARHGLVQDVDHRAVIGLQEIVRRNGPAAVGQVKLVVPTAGNNLAFQFRTRYRTICAWHGPWRKRDSQTGIRV